MGDIKVLAPSDSNVLHRADSGAMTFKVQFPDVNMAPSLTFTSKKNPERELYKIVIGRIIRIICKTESQENSSTYVSNFNHREPVEYWVTWYNGMIRMGLEGAKPFIQHKMDCQELIGYVRFDTVWRYYNVEWTIEVSPISIPPTETEILEDELVWSRMIDNKLPPDALIGGFEKEPLYVARAHCNNSLAPGKFTRSMGMAFVPWGEREIMTRDFEILCGHNAKWVPTKSNCIPQDAFIAGYSEVRNEPLYVGRAMHQGCLLIGKVHPLYKCCYLPFYGREIAVSEYEILTVPKVTRCVKLVE